MCRHGRSDIWLSRTERRRHNCPRPRKRTPCISRCLQRHAVVVDPRRWHCSAPRQPPAAVVAAAAAADRQVGRHLGSLYPRPSWQLGGGGDHHLQALCGIIANVQGADDAHALNLLHHHQRALLIVAGDTLNSYEFGHTRTPKHMKR